MEYILQNVPDYTEAKNQLEQKLKNGNKKLKPKKMKSKIKRRFKKQKELY